MADPDTSRCVMAIDPGRKKCGVAVVSEQLKIVHHEVVPVEKFQEQFADLHACYEPVELLLGDSTGSKEIREMIVGSVEIEPKVVDERHTTELAKLRYFKEYPPKGLWKLVPIGLQTPSVCYDDFAAVVLAERFWKEEKMND